METLDSVFMWLFFNVIAEIKIIKTSSFLQHERRFSKSIWRFQIKGLYLQHH